MKQEKKIDISIEKSLLVVTDTVPHEVKSANIPTVFIKWREDVSIYSGLFL